MLLNVVAKDDSDYSECDQSKPDDKYSRMCVEWWMWLFTIYKAFISRNVMKVSHSPITDHETIETVACVFVKLI